MDKAEDRDILDAARQSNVEVLTALINEVSGSVYKVYEPTNDTLLHRIAEGGYPDCYAAAKVILDNWQQFDVNAVNAKGDTALHYAVMYSDSLPLVELLLQRNANVRAVNQTGENPFHLVAQFDSPKALEIVAKLLSHVPGLIWSKTQGEGQNAFHIAAKHSAVQMLKYLWSERQGDAITSAVAENNSECGTPLYAAVQKGGDDSKTIETVEFLLNALPAEVVNALSNGNSPLHLAAMDCSMNLLVTMIRHPKVNVFKPNQKGETCMDILAGVSDQNPNAVRCTQALLKESHQLSAESEKRKLISTSINLAVKKKSTNMAQFLVKEHGNMNTVIKKADGLLENIYEKTPVAVIPMLDKAVTYTPSKEGDDEDLEQLNVDMGAITGYNWLSDEAGNESEALFGIFKSTKKQQRKILEHPVVNIFLKEKWRKLAPYTYAYIVLYVFWLGVYSTLFFELYPSDCPLESGTATTDNSSHTKKSRLPKIILSLLFTNTTGFDICGFDTSFVISLATILYAYTLFFILQELVKFGLSKDWKSYLSVITILQYVRHIGVAINITSAFMSPDSIPLFQFHFGVVLFCLSWLLFLSELAYMPGFALLLSILIKTVRNYGKFMLYFIPILIAFVPMLGRYVRKGKQFSFLLFGIIKNFILMTGEVDYKETFYEDDEPNLAPYDIVGQFILVVVVFGFGMVLANVLTGVAVKNFQDLYRDAEYETAVMQLRSIHFVDSLCVWIQEQPISSKVSQYLPVLHLNYAGESRKVKGISTNDYSDELRQRLQEIATPEEVVLTKGGLKPVKRAM